MSGSGLGGQDWNLLKINPVSLAFTFKALYSNFVSLYSPGSKIMHLKGYMYYFTNDGKKLITKKNLLCNF